MPPPLMLYFKIWDERKERMDEQNMIKLNGWISFESAEKPGSREDVLTLSYAGDFPAPDDLFSDHDNRVYSVCRYFYPGDQDIEEAEDGGVVDVTFDEEGFYAYDCDLEAGGLMRWRRMVDASTLRRGILFWKHLDWPEKV